MSEKAAKDLQRAGEESEAFAQNYRQTCRDSRLGCVWPHRLSQLHHQLGRRVLLSL